MKTNKIQARGFTLLELLIVIAILAILSATLVLVLNPAESLRKGRDVQRMTDLATLKNAIGLYLTNTTTPFLAGAASNAACQAGTNGWTGETATGNIFYSVSDSTDITDMVLDGTTFTGTAGPAQVAAANLALTNGTGWLPVNLSGLTAGSPISNLPIDATNDAAAGTSALGEMTSEGLVYRYACNADNLTFEVDARLESTEYASRMTTDGGNNSGLYEVGTKLDILGTGADF